jgi:di/tricarboxylate transporter
MGALLAVGGVRSALDEPVKMKEVGILDYPFTHPVLFAAILETLAVTLVLASLALFRLRKWGARVIEAAAWLGLLYLVAFAGFATFLLTMMVFNSDITHFQPWFPPSFAGMLVLNLGLLGTPLVLTVRHLRRLHTRAVLS